MGTQGDVFLAEHKAADDPRTVAHRAVPDFWNIVARRKLGQPDTWSWWEIRRVGDTNDAMLTGAVPLGVRRDGTPKWPLARDSQRCVVTDAERSAAQEEWSRATGLCWKCGGCGEENAGWSSTEGPRFRPCSRCKSAEVTP